MDLDLPKHTRDRIVELVQINGSVDWAASQCGVSPSAVRAYRREHERFDLRIKDAELTFKARLENAAVGRAVDGVRKPVFYKGEIVGHVQEYSDSLLQTLLKANMRNKYGDKTDITLDDQGAKLSDLERGSRILHLLSLAEKRREEEESEEDPWS